MTQTYIQDSPRQRDGHNWESIAGSNVSFVCSRCGITGYLPAKEAEAGVKTSDDCDHHVIECVMTE